MIVPKLFAAYSARLNRLIGRHGGVVPNWVVDQWQAGLRLDLGFRGPF